MAGKREAQRENAIDLMCQVATQAIGRGGYAAMTLAEVGELAGYSRGLATHHFGSKAGLLTAILDRVLAKNADEFRKATTDKAGLARLAAIADCTLHRCIQTPDEARAYLMLALEPSARWAAVQVRSRPQRCADKPRMRRAMLSPSVSSRPSSNLPRLRASHWR